ncbi:hypothetical protein [uncultured Erythrobacter sp.]|uniref:hypothetical protein n=1 Tax=uncultured Erythrobacter sp. TaxID=263913 RepID=UPI00261C9CF8|nr:hypothetical protein [uncultured Erythrobacter sp.]
MSKVTLAILFAAIVLIIVATYFDIAYLGGGPGVLLVAGLAYSYVVAKRQAALMTYVLGENQIVPKQEVRKPAQVPKGLGSQPKARSI